MKKSIIVALLLFVGVGFTVTSCGKYSEGPKMSILTKKMRITGDWKLKKYEADCSDASPDGTDYTSTIQGFWGSNFVWGIEKDGSYKMTGNFTENGTWKLGEDKDDVTFTPSSGSATTYRIVVLKNKELGLKYTNSNGTWDKIYLEQ